MSRYYISLILCFLLLTVVGCHTGIESTDKIKLSRHDRTILMPTPEESFERSISPEILSEWKPGKRFLITDDRASYILKGNFAENEFLKDSTILFHHLESSIMPDGTKSVNIVFNKDQRFYKYESNLPEEKALQEITSASIPMFIDIELIDNTSKLLAGKNLWTKTDLWYDRSGNRVKGKRFHPVTISSIETGDASFPILVEFYSDNKKFYMRMNSSGSKNDSRSFHSLFSLSDPRLKYKNISDQNWEFICNGELSNGMTKEECRLAVGNPHDVDTGRSYSQTLDIWKYNNGMYLLFADGLLIEFRK